MRDITLLCLEPLVIGAWLANKHGRSSTVGTPFENAKGEYGYFRVFWLLQLGNGHQYFSAISQYFDLFHRRGGCFAQV